MNDEKSSGQLNYALHNLITCASLDEILQHPDFSPQGKSKDKIRIVRKSWMREREWWACAKYFLQLL